MGASAAYFVVSAMKFRIVNNYVLIAELLLIGTSSFALLSAAILLAVSQLMNRVDFVSMVFGLLTLISLYAIVSVNWLVISFLSNDSILSRKYAIYWYGVLAGFFVLVFSLISLYPSYSEPYKREWLYSQINLFSFGAPLIVPVVHVFLTAWYSKGAKNV